MRTQANKSIYLLCLTIVLVSVACNMGSPQPTVTTAPQVTTPVKRYPLKGKVISIDTRGKMANIDAEAIPGFMDAMTMPYTIKPESELDKLQPGDMVAGDLVVTDDNSWLENVVVSGHAGVGTK